MANPSPSIYTYRIRKYAPPGILTPAEIGDYYAEFSTDSGTTWKLAHLLPFGSLALCTQYIVTIVNNEANFQTQYLAGKLVPVASVIAYP